jgi:tRNA uridine 5-carboxymethylaminomethyl modification enzyme
MLPKYDVIVVGAGHAGCEAAAATANLGSQTLLVTMDMNRIAQMSCNPAVGGIAKGQIVREIDALGGQMGLVTDSSTLQFRILNRSKGPAMWSPRAQCDRIKFSETWRSKLEAIKRVDFWQGTVVDLIFEDGIAVGVKTELGVEFRSKAVILTNGTFLNGVMHFGKTQIDGGRISEPSSFGLTAKLHEMGFTSGRMKTGTPVRIDGRSINFDVLQEQKGEEGYGRFSYLPDSTTHLEQKSCFITYTNPKVHKELEKGFADSPLFDGTIEGLGPRYCPSIETKLVTFSDKDRHQLFIEPEGENSIEYYINGFSSSLPWDIQLKAIQNVEGLENAKILKPGYAIEYDFFEPTQLHHTLETKLVKSLYFAGQINGTTGYEEAAAQGLVAGINAHLKINGHEPFTLSRNNAYIGVLIDDLVTKGVDEPYRMFTSRAEYRILLRQDDADCRLTPIGNKIGLVDKDRVELLNSKIEKRDMLIDFCKNFSIKPKYINDFLLEQGTSPLKHGVKLDIIVLRPQIKLADLIDAIEPLKVFVETNLTERKEEIVQAAEILLKYSGYIEREKGLADKLKRLEDIDISNKFEYETILSLSTEARQKLLALKPKTIGQASRIPGVSPSDINVLLVLMGR